MELQRICDLPYKYVGNNMEGSIELSSIFSEKRHSYLNEFTLFLAYYNAIPNFIHELEIDCKKASHWFFSNYKAEIRDCCYDKRYYNGSKQAEIDDLFYFLYDDLIVYFDTNCSIVRLLFKKTEDDKVNAIISGIKKFKKRKEGNKPEISLLICSNTGIEIKCSKYRSHGLV